MTKQITPQEVANRLQNLEEVFIVDVREYEEVALGKIPNAQHIPLGELALRKDELDKENNYVVVCQSGNRSKAACGILETFGFDVLNMSGGMNDWNGKTE